MFTVLSVDLVEILVPLGICVVMPCIIVFLVMWARKKENDSKAEVAVKAIENGAGVDANLFTNDKPKKTYKGMIFRYLKDGIICTFLGIAFIISNYICDFGDKDASVGLIFIGIVVASIGIALLITYFIGRKQFAAYLKAEEEQIGKE